MVPVVPEYKLNKGHQSGGIELFPQAVVDAIQPVNKKIKQVISKSTKVTVLLYR